MEVGRVEGLTIEDDAQAVGELRSRQGGSCGPRSARIERLLGFTDGQRVRKGQLQGVAADRSMHRHALPGRLEILEGLAEVDLVVRAGRLLPGMPAPLRRPPLASPMQARRVSTWPAASWPRAETDTVENGEATAHAWANFPGTLWVSFLLPSGAMTVPTFLTETILKTLDIEIIESGRDRVVATMPVGPKVHQPLGLLHGGASVVLAETVASHGGWENVDQATERVVGLEINANHVRGKRDGIVTATAVPFHIGRKTHVWDVRIVDEQGKLVCISRCTLQVIPAE